MPYWRMYDARNTYMFELKLPLSDERCNLTSSIFPRIVSWIIFPIYSYWCDVRWYARWEWKVACTCITFRRRFSSSGNVHKQMACLPGYKSIRNQKNEFPNSINCNRMVFNWIDFVVHMEIFLPFTVPLSLSLSLSLVRCTMDDNMMNKHSHYTYSNFKLHEFQCSFFWFTCILLLHSFFLFSFSAAQFSVVAYIVILWYYQ